jgi:glucosamine--fructose-6-phosphate aminotransferase (isomerizing)
MQKEIHEQPRAISDTLEAVIDGGVDVAGLFGLDAPAAFREIDSVLILASGTSSYAGMVARQWIEAIARLRCVVELGHEYRYRESIPNPRQLVVTISQSGETLDTMEALKRARELGHEHTLSICNVRESAIPRNSRFVYYTRAGAEIGVASTKAFTTQLVALFTLALAIAKARGNLSPDAEAAAIAQLRFVPGSVQHTLNSSPRCRPGRSASRRATTRSSWAAGSITRSRSKGPSSSRKSPISTPRRIPRASSSTARLRSSTRRCRSW